MTGAAGAAGGGDRGTAGAAPGGPQDGAPGAARPAPSLAGGPQRRRWVAAFPCEPGLAGIRVSRACAGWRPAFRLPAQMAGSRSPARLLARCHRGARRLAVCMCQAGRARFVDVAACAFARRRSAAHAQAKMLTRVQTAREEAKCAADFDYGELQAQPALSQQASQEMLLLLWRLPRSGRREAGAHPLRLGRRRDPMLHPDHACGTNYLGACWEWRSQPAMHAPRARGRRVLDPGEPGGVRPKACRGGAAGRRASGVRPGARSGAQSRWRAGRGGRAAGGDHRGGEAARVAPGARAAQVTARRARARCGPCGGSPPARARPTRFRAWLLGAHVPPPCFISLSRARRARACVCCGHLRRVYYAALSRTERACKAVAHAACTHDFAVHCCAWLCSRILTGQCMTLILHIMLLHRHLLWHTLAHRALS